MINHVKAALLIAEKDFKPSTNEQWNIIAEKLYGIQKEQSDLDAQARLLKKELIALSKDKNTCGAAYYFQREERRGSVDYGVIPELQNVDLEQYRKKPSISWRLYQY